MTCYDCIHKISERDDTYCRKNNRVIADGQGFGDCTTCGLFVQDKPIGIAIHKDFTDEDMF